MMLLKYISSVINVPYIICVINVPYIICVINVPYIICVINVPYIICVINVHDLRGLKNTKAVEIMEFHLRSISLNLSDC